MWIDVGQLIRSQVPDKNGVVLPVALSMGSYEIRQLNHRGPGTLFEGKVIYDKKYGRVTYGCSTCCGYTSSQFEFSYDPLGIPLDGEEDQEVEGYDTCYGEFVNVTSDFDSSWSTANHAIATVNAYGVHKGVAIGKTTTNASAREQIFNERQDCPIEPVYPTGPDNVSQVQITNVDLTNDEVDVTLQGPSSGTLTVTWNGPSGNPDIANETESAGSYTFNPSLDTSNLATGQYTGVTATWQGASNTYSISFDVLGTYEHTQYNTPAESQCSGGPATAYLTPGPSACAWSTVSLIQQFITQAWINGSGITDNYGTCQEYLAGCSPPTGGNQNYFREVTTVEPSCGGSVSGTTVAVDRTSPGHPLDCGDQVLIVGLGSSPGTVKTVTDSCPACVGASHIDDFSTSNACSLTSLGNFQTIRINR